MVTINPLVAALSAATIALATASSSEDNITPYFTKCPPDFKLVRPLDGLSQAESEWVHGRKAVAAQAFSGYLNRLNITGFDTKTYTGLIQQDPDYYMPVLAWSTSGGGWRSAFTGVGGLRTIDSATPGANEQKFGGLLQSLTYISGLSGGSFPTSSYPLNNFPSIDEMVASWHVDINRFGADGYSEYAAPFPAYLAQIAPKFEAGFNISAEDLLARAWAYEFVPGNATWSSIADLSEFQNFSGPLPILQATSLNTSSPFEAGVYIPTNSSPIYEWNPFEFGSWVIGWTPTKYIGTTPDRDGNTSRCVQNLDQAYFAIATVASAWNYWYLSAESNGTLGSFPKRSIEKRGSYFPSTEIDAVDNVFAQYFNLSVAAIANPSVPNPFGIIAGTEDITLADGTEGNQCLPVWSVIQPARKVDFIMAWDDDGGDEPPYSWNKGADIYDNYVLAKAAGLPFPEVPPPSTLLARNYTLKPTFFGCNVSLTTTGDETSPIVLFMSNAPYSYYTNFSAFTFSMSYTEFDGIIDNSFNFLTQGNGTLPGTENWAECVGCAAIDRSLHRAGMNRSDACEQCFAQWSWDGTYSDLPVDFVLDPSLALDPSLGFIEWNETHPFSG